MKLRHPLDPMTVDELDKAVRIIHSDGRLSDRARFASVSLCEPSKQSVYAFIPGAPIERRIDAIVLDKASKQTYRIVVDLKTDAIESWITEVPGSQPAVLSEEWELAEAIAKADPEWRAAAARRGVTDFSHVFLDPMSAGNFGFEAEVGRRIVRGVAYWRRDENDNGYAYPLERLIAVVDLDDVRLLELWDVDPVPIPDNHGRYDEASIGGFRRDLKPLEITQPDGPSFEIDGNEIRWQKWTLRASLNGREGLVIHQVDYEGRPIMYRAAMSEMVVPYGDPSSAHFWRGVFDAGEYGMGQFANSLVLGCDCLGEIRYIDGVINTERGEARIIKNAICVHEEDNGMLWKHFDGRNGDNAVRRSRRLVVSYIATVGNYEYGFYWYFQQDGSIEHEIKATGIVLTQALHEGEKPVFGSIVGQRLSAPNHQHLFSYRLDMAVDGIQNTVYEVNGRSLPTGPDNPYGNAMIAEQTPIVRESDAARDVSPQTSRYWKIVNDNKTNSLGTNLAYKLVPGHTVSPLANPDSPIRKRSGFADHQLWVTQFDPGERYAAGEYPNQSSGGDGLPKWQAADRNLINEDIVVWFTMGMTHFPRPEDWPVMPVEKVSFMLKPVGFFDRNPGIDVAPPMGHSEGHCSA